MGEQLSPNTPSLNPAQDPQGGGCYFVFSPPPPSILHMLWEPPKVLVKGTPTTPPKAWYHTVHTDVGLAHMHVHRCDVGQSCSVCPCLSPLPASSSWCPPWKYARAIVIQETVGAKSPGSNLWHLRLCPPSSASSSSPLPPHPQCPVHINQASPIAH